MIFNADNTFSEDQVYQVLLVKAQELGSQKELAKFLGISPQYVSDLIYKRRELSTAIINKLGFRKLAPRFSKDSDTRIKGGIA